MLRIWKKPPKNEVMRNPDSQVSVHIWKQHLTILRHWHNLPFKRLVIFFLNSIHQLCQVLSRQPAPNPAWRNNRFVWYSSARLKNVAAVQVQKKICTASIFYKVLLIQELSCILLKTNTISLTCCSVAKSENSSETHHIAFLASY